MKSREETGKLFRRRVIFTYPEDMYRNSKSYREMANISQKRKPTCKWVVYVENAYTLMGQQSDIFIG